MFLTHVLFQKVLLDFQCASSFPVVPSVLYTCSFPILYFVVVVVVVVGDFLCFPFFLAFQLFVLIASSLENTISTFLALSFVFGGSLLLSSLVATLFGVFAGYGRSPEDRLLGSKVTFAISLQRVLYCSVIGSNLANIVINRDLIGPGL